MLMLGQGEPFNCYANNGTYYAFNLSKLQHFKMQLLNQTIWNNEVFPYCLANGNLSKCNVFLYTPTGIEPEHNNDLLKR